MTDMDRFIEAADALKAAANQSRLALSGLVSARSAEDMLDVALTEYRAAREAITRGTPPAFATSA
jgi:hypothetical protein